MGNRPSDDSEDLGTRCTRLIEEASVVARHARDVATRASSRPPAFWRAGHVLAELRACEYDAGALAERVDRLYEQWLAVSALPVQASGYGLAGLQLSLDALERERQHRLPTAIRAADSATQQARSAVTNAFARQTQHVATCCAWLSVGLGTLSVLLAAIALA